LLLRKEAAKERRLNMKTLSFRKNLSKDDLAMLAESIIPPADMEEVC
jgi:hypothetical protein